MAEDFQTKAAEMMKKVLTVGVGALFLTEESLRILVSEFKLPKELLAAVLDSANKTKSEFFKTLSKEVMTKISTKIDPTLLVQDILRRNEIEVNVKLNFRPKGAGIAEPSKD